MLRVHHELGHTRIEKKMKIDLAFIMREEGGDIAKAQKRIDYALAGWTGASPDESLNDEQMLMVVYGALKVTKDPGMQRILQMVDDHLFPKEDEKLDD